VALALLFGARASLAQVARVSYATRTLSGAEIRIGAGQPATIVAVFATWCTTCRTEFGMLDSLQTALAQRGIRVLALSVDEKDDAHVRRYTDARRTHVLIARDASGAVSRAFGTVGVPEAYLVDTKGVIRWRGRGDLRTGVAELRTLLRQLE
jgi:cytochrome c biogenesis protein CcmG/thiol:disulfide interchange protein DsbE